MALEIRVESEATGGLKIIDHIPSDRPCRLEGRNGIGKSALVRLLVLLGGVQPFGGQPAPWRSLRELIGPTRVTIDGMSGGASELVVQLTPEQWPHDPVEEIGEWLGTATLDGQPVELARIFEMLDVVHLSGTERLIDTLKQQSGRMAIALGSVESQLERLEEDRAELGDLADELEFVAPQIANAEKVRLRELALSRRELQESLEAAEVAAADLARASAFTAMVETGDAADHQEQLAALRAELDAAQIRAREAEKKHDEAVKELASGTVAQREVAKLERQLATAGKQLDALVSRQTELGSRLESLGISAETESLEAPGLEALNAALAQIAARRHALAVAAARTHRTTAENRLLDDVRVVLDDAAEEGLSTTVVAKVGGVAITVADLREGLGVLEEVSDDDSEELTQTSLELAELTELSELFQKRSTLMEKEATLRSQLELHEPKAAGHDKLRENATETRAALDAANAEVRVHLLKIGALSRSVIGGSDVVDIEAHIEELLAKHDVQADQLQASLLEAQTHLLQLQDEYRELGETIKRLSANGARRRILRESIRKRGSSEGPLSWVGQLAGDLGAASSAEGEWSDEVWQLLADHISACKSALSTLVNDVVGLHALAPQLPTQPGALAGAIRNLVEEDALRELSSAPIADALFDGGQVRRVNLDDDSITWVTPDGEVRTRPLAAFSSGEQALGFMRARLQQIAEMPARDRLIFLDEFGAFISADRRRPLAELLTSDELRALSRQVVVVLPLQADYLNELDQTKGELHELYEHRAQEISEHGYFTEVFSG